MGVLRRERLSDQVAALVLENIRAGHYGPQDILTEPVLATALQVSRTPIREALFRLVGNGILAERGRGYCLPLLSAAEVAHMFHVRLLVEADVWDQLRPLEGADLTGLATAAKAQQDRSQDADPAPFIAANTAFRRALFGLCTNDFLTGVADHCNDRMQAYRSATLADRGVRAGVAADHAAVVVALQAGDRGAARDRYLATLRAAQSAYAALARDLTPA